MSKLCVLEGKVEVNRLFAFSSVDDGDVEQITKLMMVEIERGNLARNYLKQSNGIQLNCFHQLIIAHRFMWVNPQPFLFKHLISNTSMNHIQTSFN